MSEIDNDGFCEAAKRDRKAESDIIASSPTIPASEMTLAHRVVLRDQGDTFVVHMQIFEDGRSYFETGNYFPKRRGPGTLAEHDRIVLREAWEKFEQRSRRILGMEDDLHNYKAASDVAESIIQALLPEDEEERAEMIEDDYMLESNIDTFEHFTGKSLRKPLPDPDAEPEDEEDR